MNHSLVFRMFNPRRRSQKIQKKNNNKKNWYVEILKFTFNEITVSDSIKLCIFF